MQVQLPGYGKSDVSYPPEESSARVRELGGTCRHREVAALVSFHGFGPIDHAKIMFAFDSIGCHREHCEAPRLQRGPPLSSGNGISGQFGGHHEQLVRFRIERHCPAARHGRDGLQYSIGRCATDHGDRAIAIRGERAPALGVRTQSRRCLCRSQATPVPCLYARRPLPCAHCGSRQTACCR